MKKLNKNLIVTTVVTVALVLGIRVQLVLGGRPSTSDCAGNFVILTKQVTNVLHLLLLEISELVQSTMLL